MYKYIDFKPIKSFGLSEEVKKVIEEAAEVRAAYQYDSCAKIIEETFDTMQVCANILEILVPENTNWNDAYKNLVVRKNIKRGYYDD